MVAGRDPGGRWPLLKGAFGPCGPADGRRQSRGALVLHSRPFLALVLSYCSPPPTRSRLLGTPPHAAPCWPAAPLAPSLSIPAPYRAPILLFFSLSRWLPAALQPARPPRPPCLRPLRVLRHAALVRSFRPARSGSRPPTEKMASRGNFGHSAAKLLPGVRNSIYRRENAPKWLIWAPMRPPKNFGRRRPHTTPAGVFGFYWLFGFFKKKRKPPSGAATGRLDPDRPPCTELYTKIPPGDLSFLTNPLEISSSSTASAGPRTRDHKSGRPL